MATDDFQTLHHFHLPSPCSFEPQDLQPFQPFPNDVTDFAPLGEGSGQVVEDGQASLSEREVCAHPMFETLVRLVYQARMQGEEPQRQRLLKVQRDDALGQLLELRREHAGVVPDAEADMFLSCSCRMIEEFMYEVHLYSDKANSVYNLFKQQVSLILSGGGVRATMKVCQGDEKELRNDLKRKYADSIVKLTADFTARKKKGKLPNEATCALKSWWDANLVWPYPSEDNKKSLEEATGLTATQINNWFINQRKRHWHKFFKDGRLPQTQKESRDVLQMHGFDV